MRGINRIGLKLGAAIAALLLIVILALGLIIDRVFTGFYHTRMGEDVEELTRHFAGMAELHESGSDEMIHMFAEFSNVSISMVDKEGRRTADLGSLKVADSSFITKTSLAELELGRSVRFEFAASSGERYFVSAQPIAGGGHASSALYVLSSMRSMDESLERVRILIAVSAAAAFLMAIAFSYFMSQVLSRPLVQMEKAARTIAKGRLEKRLPVGSRDEIGTLAKAINDLSQDLQHYRDTRQEFFANVSHELRTPVTYLEGYTRVIKDGLYESEEEKEQYLAIIHQEAQRLKRLIHDLFELSKMEEGKVNLSMEWLDIGELVEGCVNKARLKAREKKLQLLYHPAQNALFVYGDGLRLEQVVMNLLDNAIQYTEEGRVEVTLTSAAREVGIAVLDTGIGIPEEELPYIFERFYRVEKSRSREFGGTGLGLAISRKLIELQGGTLEASSTPGEGTAFTIRIPLTNV
jgi:signal transduction histidine kinase